MFRTNDNLSQWVEGVEFKGGAYITVDESKAEELRRNRNVTEVIDEEKEPEPIVAQEKPKAKPKRGK